MLLLCLSRTILKVKLPMSYFAFATHNMHIIIKESVCLCIRCLHTLHITTFPLLAWTCYTLFALVTMSLTKYVLQCGIRSKLPRISIKLISTIDHLQSRTTPPTLVYWHANFNLDEVQALNSVKFEFELTHMHNEKNEVLNIVVFLRVLSKRVT